MNPFERNYHSSGRIANIRFGLAHLVDGLVRVLSLGFMHTRFPSNVSRNETIRQINKMRKLNARRP